MAQSKRAFFGDAERMYVEEGASLPAVAALLPISPTTARRWAKEGDWPRKRQVFLSSPKSALALATELLKKKIAEINALPPESVDAAVIKELTSLVKAVNELNKTYRPYELAVLAGGEFVNYVSREVTDAKLRVKIFDVYSSFVEEMRRTK